LNLEKSSKVRSKEVMMDTKKKAKLLRYALVSALVLVLMLTIVVGVWADVGIDTFSETFQAINYTMSGSETFPFTQSAFASASETLGGHRDMCLTFNSGDPFTSGTFLVNHINDYLQLSLASTVEASAIVQWDGSTDATCTIDPTGLSTDLTESGSNTGVLVRVVNSDGIPVNITVSIWTDGSNWAKKTVRFDSEVATGQAVDIFLPWGSFVNQTGTMNPASVGAVELEVDGTIQDGADLTIKLIKATGDAYEYGDLPTGIYSNITARHIPQGLRLGNNVDGEGSHNSSPTATGDDTQQSPDDEDGVTLVGLPWSAGATEYVSISRKGCEALAGGCYINGWIDWDCDGSFEPGEQIVNDVHETTDASSNYGFTTPDPFASTYYYARFRICTAVDTCDDPTNTQTDVVDGEIEDYYWQLGPTAVELSAFDATWNGNRILVAWETAMEIDTVGFNVWRSTAEDGGYVQVNSGLIPAESLGGVMGGSYTFTDAGVTPGMVYYYKLEELEVGGARNWYGPTSTGDGSPTAVTLSAAATALAWWPVAAGVLAGGGLMTFVVLRRRRQHQ
jgi:hypothetical protein